MVLVFVNAIHPPVPSPSPGYQLGQVIRRAVERYTGAKEVMICASGGLSHFTASFPYEFMEGSLGYGEISQEFDQKILAQMSEGRGEEIATLSAKDLLENGDTEFLSWVVMLGAIGNAEPEVLAYAPTYRGIMGMGAGFWHL